jgi:hypothetical protein
MRENRPYGSMRGGGGKTELTTAVGSIRAYHPAYSTRLRGVPQLFGRVVIHLIFGAKEQGTPRRDRGG